MALRWQERTSASRRGKNRGLGIRRFSLSPLAILSQTIGVSGFFVSLEPRGKNWHERHRQPSWGANRSRRSGVFNPENSRVELAEKLLNMARSGEIKALVALTIHSKTRAISTFRQRHPDLPADRLNDGHAARNLRGPLMIERDPATGFPIFRPDGRGAQGVHAGPDFPREDHPGAAGVGHVVGVLHAYFPEGAGAAAATGRQAAVPGAYPARDLFEAGRDHDPDVEGLVQAGDGRRGEFGIFYETRPYLHEVRVGPLELDVIFMAMEDIRDAKSYFMSLETSLIWFNEVQFAQYEVFSEAVGRVSPPRFPAVKDGGCAWGGLIIDTNAPAGGSTGCRSCGATCRRRTG